MIHPSSTLNRIFLCAPKVRNGFARIEYTTGGVTDSVDIIACGGRGTGQGLQEVKCGTFGSEHSSGRARNFTQYAIDDDSIPIPGGPVNLYRLIALFEGFFKPGGAT